MNIDSVRQSALAAVSRGGGDHLGEWAYECEMMLLECVPYPDSFFELVCELLDDSRIQNCPASGALLTLFVTDWEAWSPEQHARLLPVLEKSYPKFRDEFACYCIADLLGRHYITNAGFDVLQRLTKIDPIGPRSFIPYGLRLFIENTDDESLRGRAIEALRSMCSDLSEEVSNQATLELELLE